MISWNDITKTMYCYQCSTSTEESTYTISITNVSSTATSNYAKSGAGYARITIVELTYGDPRLSSIDISGEISNFNFDPDTYTYTYDIGTTADNSFINKDAKTLQEPTVVTGNVFYELNVGTTTIELISTVETGEIAFIL